MYFEERYKPIQHIDIEPLLQKLLELDPKDWAADEAIRYKLAGERPTQSIFLLNIHENEWVDLLRQRPLLQSDIPKCQGWEKLHSLIWPLLEKILGCYPPGGIITRVQLALLPAGNTIASHLDTSFLLRACHRIHLPLISHESVHFEIEGETFFFEPGKAVELNNRLKHAVYNRSPIDRVHLLFDYLPPAHNDIHILSQRSPFLYRTSLADDRLPIVLVTSVVRGAHKNQSHGGLYQVDFQESCFQELIDWNTSDIDFQGRGWDRGLRGMALFGPRVFVVASDELFCFQKDSWALLGSWKNPYLKHAHEICIYGSYLYITSTGYDSLLRFNLHHYEFDQAWMIRMKGPGEIAYKQYHPGHSNGPEQGNTLHLNSVSANHEGLYLSGKNFPQLIRFQSNKTETVAELPLGTHNAQPYKNGVIYNDTAQNKVTLKILGRSISVPVPVYKEEVLVNTHYGDQNLARQAFARGLCPLKNTQVLVGSSPSTVSIVDFTAQKVIHSMNLTLDIRHAIHGLEILSLN